MLISIFIPTRNRVKSLNLALQSVLRQTYRNIEVIVTDDGSTDDTPNYLTELARADHRLKFIRNNPSQGACQARNAAIKLSKGDYLTGLDDDDEFLPNHVAALLDYWNLLTKYSVEPLSCIFSQYLDRNDEVLSQGRRLSRVQYFDLFDENRIGNQIFAPRSHFFGAGLYDEQMPAWQDIEFFFRVLKKFGPARLLDMPTYIFDVSQRPDRISVGQKQKIVAACSRMIALHAPDNPRNKQKLLLQMYAKHYGFQVTAGDFIAFAKHGVWLDGYDAMARKFIATNFPFLQVLRRVPRNG